MIKLSYFTARWLQARFCLATAGFFLAGCSATQQVAVAPDVLQSAEGQKIRNTTAWEQQRRPEILDLFTREVYGSWPAKEQFTTSIQVMEAPTAVREGKAFRQQVRLNIRNERGDTLPVDLLIYYPVQAHTQPVPTLLTLNFLGNHAQVADPEVLLSQSDIYTGRPQEHGIVGLRATEAARGDRTRRFPVDMMIDQGFAVITAGYQDFMPDQAEAYLHRIRDFYGMAPEETGAISIWAWGYGQLLQYARQQSAFKVGPVAIQGHSRLGKAALWAAAQLDDISAAFINESGCMGAALSRRAEGETIERINSSFPHWFNARFKTYNGQDKTLPFDQHWLLAAVAPRPIHIGVASEDEWSDPEGMFLALRAAEPAYRLYGKKFDLPGSFPAPDQAILTGAVGFHHRPGQHDLLGYDWQRYLGFWRQQLSETQRD